MKHTTLFISLITTLLFLLSIPLVWSDSDHLDEYKRKSVGFEILNNTEYSTECGSCHMAYPSSLLAASSWARMMGQLDNHFGDNAELSSQEVHNSILHYLLNNSADQSRLRMVRKMQKSVDIHNSPLRITQLPYFIHEHNEIPQSMISNNPQVNSLSHCNACHKKAEQGLFDEHSINIPGFGRWDD